MSQICYDEITLQEVVAATTLVVVVRPADPVSTIEEIAVGAPALEPGEPAFLQPGETVPPFTKVTLHYVVEEVLLNETGEPCAPGQVLDVRRANWRQELEAHVNYYGRGLSESPIYRQYVGSHDDQEVPFIALLTRERGEWLFAVDGAVEALAARDEVLHAIADREPAVRLVPGSAAAERPGFWARLFGRKR